MTLADIKLPVSYEWARGYALAFPAQLAERLAEVQEIAGDGSWNLIPQSLADGRFLCNADVLTECVPGGFLHHAFSQLDASKFDQIEVLRHSDAAALLPPEPKVA